MSGKIACGRSEGLYFRVNFCIVRLGVVCRYLQFILCERVLDLRMAQEKDRNMLSVQEQQWKQWNQRTL
jgi:hypothetical protein